MEHTRMLSAGIDIGTSTTSVIISRLTVGNTAGYFTVPSVDIVGKEVIYRGPVHRTPLIDGVLIDGDALVKIIEQEYRKAGVSPEQVETGAVIVTGESARKENARMILDQMSRFAGDFVVSTAGPDLESVIAGKGSGAWQFSEENGAVAVNLDIGGGTANLVLFDGGEVCSLGCVDIGGRQVVLDPCGKITYMSPSAKKIAEYLRLPLREGQSAKEGLLESLCDGMCQVLEQMLGITEETELLSSVLTSGAKRFRQIPGRPIRYVFFSGGVADCIYRPVQDRFAYRDIGILLAEAIRRGKIFGQFRVMESKETIRATVIGAGSYTTTVSGSTITYKEGLFPLRNVPVLKLNREEEQRCWQGGEEFLAGKVRWFLDQNDAVQMVLAMEGRKNPDYVSLKKLSETLCRALHETLPQKEPLIVAVRADIAKALGQLLRQRLMGARPVISVDQVRMEENDFVDFGRPIMDGLVIPMSVKTLIFG